MNQILESQQTPHTSPSRASYGVSFVKILEKTDHVITAPHCKRKTNKNAQTTTTAMATATNKSAKGAAEYLTLAEVIR